MIKLDNVTFTYRGAKVEALSGVTASIGSGLYLLAGENGAGKTTLLHVLGGVSRPCGGVCELDGAVAWSTAPQSKERVFLLEEHMFFPGKSIRDFARGHSVFYPGFSEEQFTRNLAVFGQSGVEPLSSLSLGNRKKAQLAYVLALGVDYLLLDEPTNALDIEGREALIQLLTTVVSPDQTVIVSTHNVGDLERLFDGAIILRGSRLLFAGLEDEVSDRLAFGYSGSPDPDALYAERQGTRFMCVYPADEPGATRVDWRALYRALHSEKSDNILSILRK